MARIAVKVVPGAARSAVAGWLGDALKLRVAAPPVKGRANAAAEALLAELLGVPVHSVRVVAGHGAARKQVEIGGLSAQELRRRLERIAPQ